MEEKKPKEKRKGERVKNDLVINELCNETKGEVVVDHLMPTY